MLDAYVSLVDDDEKPAFNFSDDFAGGFSWMASTEGQTLLPDSFEMRMLVDNSATELVLEDDLVSGSKDMTIY